MIYITRRERFTAAHRLFRADWSDAQNNEMFGGCANPNWHGHNYEIYVTVKGNVDPKLGYLVNLKDLSKLIHVNVTDKLDHKNLNLDVDFLKDVMTSTENVAIAIWNQLQKPVSELGAELHCIKLVETENNSVEYFG
ncbi:MAG TPA: 6-carboxytetrahydropterin synthase [Bacteroidia bacterium]|nr:6-carboxytetrahydropterin synthase [Bacteroidia bacterium]